MIIKVLTVCPLAREIISVTNESYNPCRVSVSPCLAGQESFLDQVWSLITLGQLWREHEQSCDQYCVQLGVTV